MYTVCSVYIGLAIELVVVSKFKILAQIIHCQKAGGQ